MQTRRPAASSIRISQTWVLPPRGIGRGGRSGVSGELDLTDIVVTEDENCLIEPEAEAGDTTPDAGELGEHIKIRLTLKSSLWGSPKLIYEGLLKDIQPHYDVDEMLPQHDYDFIIEGWWWPQSATDSQAMTDVVKLSMKFQLQQLPD